MHDPSPGRWRKRVDSYQLEFDRLRQRLIGVNVAAGATTLGDALDLLERVTRELGPGGKYSTRSQVGALPPHLSLLDGLVDLIRRFNVEALAASPPGYTDWQKRLLIDWSCGASSYLTGYLLLSPRTKLFLADAALAADVVCSDNAPLQGEDLGHLPFPQTWLEFDEPVPIARGFTRVLNAVAAVFYSHASGLRFVSLLAPGGRDELRENSVTLLFWGEKLLHLDAPQVLRDSLGGVDDPAEFETQIRTACRNLYDFLTSRSFDYAKEERPHKDLTAIKRFRHLQGGLAQGVREYRRVRVNREVVGAPPAGAYAETLAIGTETAAEVPGCFHRWVYCRACGDLHRHDLIGRPCRKCAATVGPTANLRVERYWHPPYLRGSGKIKEYVRHLLES